MEQDMIGKQIDREGNLERLSTGSMNGSQYLQEYQQTPSINEIIEWLTEQSIDRGTVGWTTNAPEADFFQRHWPAKWDATAEVATYDKENESEMLEAALNDSYVDHKRLVERREYMKSNPAVLMDAELEVNRRLIQAGKTQQDMDTYGDRLQHKVEELYRLEHPDPPKNYIKAFFFYGARGAQRSAPINLHINDTLWNFESGIRVYIDCLRNTWESLGSIYNIDSPWKYRWVPKDKSTEVRQDWSPLEVDQHYADLIRQAGRPDKARHRLFLMQKVETKPAPHGSTHETEADNLWDLPLQDTNVPDEERLFDTFDLSSDLGRLDAKLELSRPWKETGDEIREAYAALGSKDQLNSSNEMA